MKFDPELKKAISLLPSAEKDKLIFRLLKYDLDLANRLSFQLLSTKDVKDKRHEVEVYIKEEIERSEKYFYSLGYVLMGLRDISGAITEHVKITQDKFGEPFLNLLMLTEALKRYTEKIKQATLDKSYTLNIYIIARIFKILVLIKALHEDYMIEFEEQLIELGQMISDNPPLMKTAVCNGFDVNWLLNATIPDNISDIHKDVRKRGLLK